MNPVRGQSWVRSATRGATTAATAATTTATTATTVVTAATAVAVATTAEPATAAAAAVAAAAATRTPAAAARTTTTPAAAESAATAAESATTASRSAFLGFVDAERPAFELEFLLEGAGRHFIVQLYEGKSPGAAGLAIGNHSDGQHFTHISKQTSNVAFRR